MLCNFSQYGNIFRPFPRPPFNTAARQNVRAILYTLTGITKDNSGAPLGSCLCHIFKYVAGGPCVWMGFATSDGSGNYSFSLWIDNNADKFVVSWKDASPHVFDVTDHVLQPV